MPSPPVVIKKCFEYFESTNVLDAPPRLLQWLWSINGSGFENECRSAPADKSNVSTLRGSKLSEPMLQELSSIFNSTSFFTSFSHRTNPCTRRWSNITRYLCLQLIMFIPHPLRVIISKFPIMRIFLTSSVTRWLQKYLLMCLYLIRHFCVYCLLKSFLFCSSIVGNFSKKILYCSSHMLIIITLLHSDVSTFNYFLSYTLHPNSYLYLNLGSFFLVKHTSPNGRHTLTLIIDICNTGLYFDFTFTPKKKL